MREKYGVEKIVADNYKLDILRPLLEAEGFEVEGIRRPSSIHPLLAPRVEDGFANRKFIFGDNPLMRWYTNNVYVKETQVGKQFLKKEEVKRKTDGFQAFVHALYRANELEDEVEFFLDDIAF
jgi:phage terminase large subunit-like protein